MLLARLGDTLNAETETAERKYKELKCELARKSADLERLKEMCGLEDEGETSWGEEEVQTLEWTSLDQESLTLQQSIASVQAQLASLQSPSDSSTLLSLLEAKALKEEQLRAAQTLYNQTSKEFEQLTYIVQSIDTQKAQFQGKIRQFGREIRDIKGKLAELEDVKGANLVDLCVFPAHLIAYMKDLEERRAQDIQTLSTKRKEWKQAETTLVDQYEEELKSLEKELEEAEKAGGGEKSSPKPMFRRKKAEKEENGLDLESLLGHSGPTLERIQEVARQYRSAKEDTGFFP